MLSGKKITAKGAEVRRAASSSAPSTVKFPFGSHSVPGQAVLAWCGRMILFYDLSSYVQRFIFQPPFAGS